MINLNLKLVYGKLKKEQNVTIDFAGFKINYTVDKGEDNMNNNVNKKLIIQVAKEYLKAKQKDKVAYYIALGKLVGVCEAFDLVFYDNNDTIILYRKKDRRTAMQVAG